MFLERLGAVRKDSLHVTLDKEPIHQRATRHGVNDLVAAKGAAVFFHKGMGVAPTAIRPTALFITKTIGRVPAGDFRAPADGQAVHAQLVINQGSVAHLDVAGREDVEIQPRGREGFQVAGVGEEGEHFFTRHR